MGRADAARRRNPMKLVPLALSVVVLAVYAAGAAAAPTRQASFCGTAKGVAAYIVNSGSLISPTGSETLQSLERKLKFDYGAIIHAEPALKSSAPRTIKPDLLTAFSLVNFVNARMTAIGWDFTKALPFEKTLVTRATAAKPAIQHLSAYFKGTCHIKGA